MSEQPVRVRATQLTLPVRGRPAHARIHCAQRHACVRGRVRQRVDERSRRIPGASMIMRAAGLAASAAVAAAALGAHAVDVSQEGFMFSGYGCDRSCDQGDVNYEIEYVGGGSRQSRVSATCLPHDLARAVPLSRCLALWAMARALAPVHALSRAHHTVCGHAAPSARASVVQPWIREPAWPTGTRRA